MRQRMASPHPWRFWGSRSPPHPCPGLRFSLLQGKSQDRPHNYTTLLKQVQSKQPGVCMGQWAAVCVLPSKHQQRSPSHLHELWTPRWGPGEEEGTGQGSSQELGSRTRWGSQSDFQWLSVRTLWVPTTGLDEDEGRPSPVDPERLEQAGSLWTPMLPSSFKLAHISLSLAALREQTTQTEAKDMVLIFCRPVGLNIFSHGPFLFKCLPKESEWPCEELWRVTQPDVPWCREGRFFSRYWRHSRRQDHICP